MGNTLDQRARSSRGVGVAAEHGCNVLVLYAAAFLPALNGCLHRGKVGYMHMHMHMRMHMLHDMQMLHAHAT
jgi:hypothetical protein